MDAEVTADRHLILGAAAVILPGVGALGGAMESLRQRDLIGVLRDAAASGKPLIGICLGMQLLMTESHEFGRHKGLGIIEGEVTRLPETRDAGRPLKVPNVGWSRISSPQARLGEPVPGWSGSMIAAVPNGSFMYFVHSYVARPRDSSFTLSTTSFGPAEFCSSFSRDNVFACQFHPERSGPAGLKVYETVAAAAGRIAGA